MITAGFHAAAAAFKKQVERGRAWWEKPRPDRGGPRLRFWLILAWQTWRGRDLLPLSQETRDNYTVRGLENIPDQGVFTLAVNHTMRRWTPRLLAAVHHASIEKRPELARHWIVIVGYREANLTGRSRPARWVMLKIRRVHTWIYHRWSYNALRLPMDDQRADLQALRQWKTRARKQPTIVFPEGRGAKTFEQVRPGAGRFLAGLNVPVLPVSVWWETEGQRWQLVFGPPISWSADSRLHDLQIGLEIAYGLPSAEAPRWQTALAAWEEAYQAEDQQAEEGANRAAPDLSPTLT
jgi:1-acyl-sn-glycerol-3-phosphate acyltransferase